MESRKSGSQIAPQIHGEGFGTLNNLRGQKRRDVRQKNQEKDKRLPAQCSQTVRKAHQTCRCLLGVGLSGRAERPEL